MDREFRSALLRYETDLDGAKDRFIGNEELYIQCLIGFVQDNTMAELEKAVTEASWDEAFTAAHALKGLAGNMGFVPLFHASAELVVLIRTGRTSEVWGSYLELKRNYEDIVIVINDHCAAGGIDK